MRPTLRIAMVVLYPALAGLLHLPLLAQTSSSGNPDVYTRERSSTAVGYLSTTMTVPSGNSLLQLKQQGLLYMTTSPLGTLGDINFGSRHQFYLSFERAFRFGLGVGSSAVPPSSGIEGQNMVYYAASLDIFSLDLVPEYIFVVHEGLAITLKLNVTILNLGVTAAMKERTNISESGIAVMNFAPLSFSPSLVFDFGRTGLGFRLYNGGSNFLTYRYCAPLLAEENKGFKFNDRMLKRMSAQIVFTY